MKLRNATAPAQAEVIADIEQLLMSRIPEVPEDGPDRVNYRLEIALAGYGEDEPGDPGLPVRDLLTDILHLCHDKGWNIHHLLARASSACRGEQTDWGTLDRERERDELEVPC